MARSDTWRAAVAGVVVAVAAVLALGAASPAHADVRDITSVCPAPDGDDVGFDDVVDGATHTDAIRCAAGYGLVAGFTDGTYGPGQPVTRGQLATVVRGFVETALGLELPPAGGDATFTDVAGSVHRDAIERLAAVGVLTGRDDGSFGPSVRVRRDQFAGVLIAAMDLADNPGVTGSLRVPTDGSGFEDTDGTFFQPQVESLAGLGVVAGASTDRYDPGGPVTRGQLATFLLRAASALHHEQRFEPTAVILTSTVTLTGDEVVAVDLDTGEVALRAGEPGARALAAVRIDAFGGVLDVSIDVSGLTAPFEGAGGLRLRTGAAGEIGPLLAVLADADTLAAAQRDGVPVTVRVLESDLAPTGVRLSDLQRAPHRAHLTVHTAAYPAGAVRGQLGPAPAVGAS